MIPSTKEWYGVNVGSNSMTELHVTFGWKVHKHSMPVGSKLKMVATQAIPASKVPNRAMYTRGRAVVQNEDGTTFPDRVPGMYTQDRTGQPAGITVVEAVEDLEFWCFNYTINRNSLPELTPLLKKRGDRLTVFPEDNIFVMRGRVGNFEAPCSFHLSESTDLLVEADLYAFYILKEKT